jgi:UDP-3-O-[3-hydroxymyristoyl] glucosamine N-acyltransferase
MLEELEKKVEVIIGKNTYIDESAKIGALPFVFGFDEGKIWRTHRKNPVLKIIIGDNVWIGANTTIQAGWGKSTIICDHVKIDHNVMIAHDCYLDERCIIVAGCVLGGHTKVGKDTFLAINVGTKSLTTIGNRTLIGMGSNVTHNIPDGVIAWGNPCEVKRKNLWYPPDSLDVYPEQTQD